MNPTNNKLSRRHFLASSTALIAAFPATASIGAWPTLPGSLSSNTSNQYFVSGVASGDPSHDRVILWTRLSNITGTQSIQWDVATDANFFNTIQTGSVWAEAANDHTVSVDVSDLQPDTYYFYRFRYQFQTSVIGRTKTLPTGNVEHMRFALATCSHQKAGYYNAYRHITTWDLDAVIHLGDYIYEYLGSENRNNPQPGDGREVYTLDDYRLNFQRQRLDLDLQLLHQTHPMIAIWDDHEIVNNAWEHDAPNHNNNSEGPWIDRKNAARKAYHEWMPIRELPNPSAEREASSDLTSIYRRFSGGNLADLFMLDGRMAGRTDYTLGRNHPDATILGEEQENWLFSGLHTSNACWKLIGNPVMFGHLFETRNNQPYPCLYWHDQWDGYTKAKQRVFDVMTGATYGTPIENIAFLTGDWHNTFIMDVAESPLHTYNNGDNSLAVEFVTPSITSGTFDINPNDLTNYNPHIKYHNRNNGYIILDITPERLTAELWYVDRVDQPSDHEY